MSPDKLKRLYKEMERICEGPEQLLFHLRRGVFPKDTFTRFEKLVRDYRDLLRKKSNIDRNMAGLLHTVQFYLDNIMEKSHDGNRTPEEIKLIMDTWDRFEGLMSEIYYGD